MELKEILEWQIAYRLRSVPGVTEVSPEGGFTKQYHVVIDPARLVNDLVAVAPSAGSDVKRGRNLLPLSWRG